MSEETGRLQLRIKVLEEQYAQLATRDIDLRKRRVVNASASVKGDDYVIRDELNALYAKLKGETPDIESFVLPSMRGTY